MEPTQLPRNQALEHVLKIRQRIQNILSSRLFGVSTAIDEILAALLASGHILLEDVPGVGKTMLAKSFADILGLSFHRIQCTPDMLPADVTGGFIYSPKTGEFELRKGPVFAQVLLVDEINRALPRTQSALLEAMAERQVTIDGQTHHLPEPFLVIATQNHIESQGVFPLPEAQLDRFMIRTHLGYPSEAEDFALLRKHLTEIEEETQLSALEVDDVHHLLTAVKSVQIADDVLGYIVQLVRSTRTMPGVQLGASPRSMVMLARMASAFAALSGRVFVTPDDVQRVVPIVLHHRLSFVDYHLAGPEHAENFVNTLLEMVDPPVEPNLR